MSELPKTGAMQIRAVVDLSEAVVAHVGSIAPTPRIGAAALALALGRVSLLPGVDLEQVFALVRLGRDGRTACALRLQLEEELFDKG